VELADAGEAGLQHLGEGVGADRLQVLRRHVVEEAIHHLAPGPEVVRRRAAGFGQPRHAALEGVAVHVAETGEANGVTFVARLRGDARLDRRDRPISQGHAHRVRPAAGQQSCFEPELSHDAAPRISPSSITSARKYV
jgi:hypothetical protein